MNSKTKIFSLSAISLASFIGGPLAGGILLYKNFRTFKKDRAAKNTIFLSFLFLTIIIALFFTIPEYLESIFIKTFLPIINALIFTLITIRYQKKDIQDHLESGVKKQPFWKSIFYSASTILGIIVLYYILMLTLPFKGYERATFITPRVRLHAQESVDKKDFYKIAGIIRNAQYFTETAVFLDKIDYKLELTIIYKDSAKYFSDNYNIKGINYFQNYLNYCFSNKNEIVVNHSDKYFGNSMRLELQNYQKKKFDDKYKSLSLKTRGNNQIYYDNSIPLSDINKFENAISKLKYYYPENAFLTFVLFDTKIEYDLVLNVHSMYWDNNEFMETMRQIEDYINYEQLTKKVTINLLDLTHYDMIKINQSP